jgi:hypothetical protein
MDKQAIRQALKEHFANRDLDKIADRLFPMMTKARIDSILNKDADFDPTDVMVLVSAENEIIDGGVVVPQNVRDLMDKLRPLMGSISGIGRH